MDVLDRADLPFPHSLPEFQRLFPDDAACAAYLEKARWGDGFACPHCGTAGEPFHFENRPGVLRCRKCRQNTGLTVGTVMERSHTPLNVWFWAAYLRQSDARHVRRAVSAARAIESRAPSSTTGKTGPTVAPGSLIVTDDWSGYDTSLLPSVVIQRLPSNTCRSSIWFSPDGCRC